jgi:DNA gyrase subunit A
MMVAIKEAVETDDVVVVTSNGMIIRQHASDIRVAGRNTQGVRLIRLDQGDAVADIAIVMAEEEEEKRLAEKESVGKDNQPKEGKSVQPITGKPAKAKGKIEQKKKE